MIIKIQQTDKTLSAFAGLTYFAEILKTSQLEAKVYECLPSQMRGKQKNLLKPASESLSPSNISDAGTA